VKPLTLNKVEQFYWTLYKTERGDAVSRIDLREIKEGMAFLVVVFGDAFLSLIYSACEDIDYCLDLFYIYFSFYLVISFIRLNCMKFCIS